MKDLKQEQKDNSVSNGGIILGLKKNEERERERDTHIFDRVHQKLKRIYSFTFKGFGEYN